MVRTPPSTPSAYLTVTRFSQLYLRPTKLFSDSVRMRIRLDVILEVTLRDYEQGGALAHWFRAELGALIDNEDAPFSSLELRNVLDGNTADTTFVGSADRNSGYSDQRDQDWILAVNTVLREEHVSYRIDTAGIVHPAIHEEFEHGRVTTLAGLGATRYGAARREYDEAFKQLRGDPPNEKAAIRGVFIAVETVFKLMFDKVSRLGSGEIRTHLKPVVARTYAGDATARRSMDKPAESFVSWADAAHFYRHARGKEERTEPPLETTVLLVSQGSAFLPWLMTVDAAKLARADGAKDVETASDPEAVG